MTYAGALEDLSGVEALFPKALAVAVAGRHVANGELGRVKRGQV
jgi:hypothetical protein